MMMTLRFLRVVALAISLLTTLVAEEDVVNKGFFFACSGGEVDKVKAFLKEHPGAYVHESRVVAALHVIQKLTPSGFDSL